jgi:recombination protein RecA
MGIVKKSGAWFTMGEERLGQGRENAKTFLNHNPEVMSGIKQQILGGTPDLVGRLSYAGMENGVIPEEEIADE